MRRQAKRGREIRGRLFILLIVFLLLLGYGFIFMNRIVKPTIISIGETKAKAMLTQVVNDVVREKFTEDVQSGNLLNIKTDDEGKVTMVQADSAAMTRLSYDLAGRIQSRIKHMDEEKVMVPVGTILGSQILSQTGPKMNLKVLPLGTTQIAFTTEFEETGINQTKYKVYLVVKSKAKVLVPFSTNNIDVETVLLVAETIIVGDVPQTYVNVPEQEIMDAVDIN